MFLLVRLDPEFSPVPDGPPTYVAFAPEQFPKFFKLVNSGLAVFQKMPDGNFQRLRADALTSLPGARKDPMSWFELVRDDDPRLERIWRSHEAEVRSAVEEINGLHGIPGGRDGGFV